MFKNFVKEYLRTMHQKKAVRAVTAATIFLGLPIIGPYSYLLAVRRLKLEQIPIKLHNQNGSLKGCKIAQISDLHYGPTNRDKDRLHKAVDIINAQKPDIVVLTGDYYQWDPEYLYELPEILSRIRAKLGVFGCLGNHDYGSCYPGEINNDPFEFSIIKAAFERNGIKILTNESVELKYKNDKLNLIGLHDLWSGMFDPDDAFKNVNNDQPTIVLSHNPDTIKLVEHDFDLMLSGHSHGGQVSWPIIGPLLIPLKDRNLRRGMYQISKRKKLYVNRGLGHTFRMRLNSPPEISLFEIT